MLEATDGSQWMKIKQSSSLTLKSPATAAKVVSEMCLNLKRSKVSLLINQSFQEGFCKMAVIGKVLESLGYFAYQNSTFLVLFSFTFFLSFLLLLFFFGKTITRTVF